MRTTPTGAALLLGALLLGQGGAAQATLVNYQAGGVDLVWEVAWDPGLAWFFSTNSGYRNFSGESSQFYGWAVRPGRVDAAPLFATGLLMALGSAALGVSRRGRCRSGLWRPRGSPILVS